MVASAAFDTSFALDANNLAGLKRAARENSPAAFKQVAQQFEALFLQMVLKSMREASSGDGLFDSEQTKMYQSMLDQQLAQNLSTRGTIGLAAALERQLARQAGAEGPAEAPQGAAAGGSSVALLQLVSQYRRGAAGAAEGAASPAGPAAATANVAGAEGAASSARAFVDRVWPHALEASRATGIPAAFLVGQAALETGWGRAEPRRADGRPSHNLFGIKAGRNWDGPVAESVTTEYVNGVAQKQVERFRAYGSYAEAFRDYASLLQGQSRYAAVLNQTDAAGFARALQQSGYATDPAYGAKLERIIGGGLLRAGLSG